MSDYLLNNQGWEQTVAIFCEEVGDNIPQRADLTKFIIKPGWLNGNAANFHQEGHAAEVLVGVNILRELLFPRGKLLPVLNSPLWRDVLSAGAVGHDLEITDEAKDMTSPAYLNHGWLASLKLPRLFGGVIDPIAADWAAALCIWHVPDDEFLPQ